MKCPLCLETRSYFWSNGHVGRASDARRSDTIHGTAWRVGSIWLLACGLEPGSLLGCAGHLFAMVASVQRAKPHVVFDRHRTETGAHEVQMPQ
jgi:hypothetical protein